jgi:hypothetical protein
MVNSVKNSFAFSAALCIISLFLGCLAITPITENILTDVGPDKTVEFRYYISKCVTLRKVGYESIAKVQNRELYRESSKERDTVIIKKSLKGVAQETFIRKAKDKNGKSLGRQINVSFEKYEGKPVIWFGQYYAGTDKKLYILYDNVEKRLIKYGGADYYVDYDGIEPPYLIIRTLQKHKEKSKTRRASGLVHDQ